MATRQNHQIVETSTEARQAEPGALGAGVAFGFDRARGADPRHPLVCVLPYLSGSGIIGDLQPVPFFCLGLDALWNPGFAVFGHELGGDRATPLGALAVPIPASDRKR